MARNVWRHYAEISSKRSVELCGSNMNVALEGVRSPDPLDHPPVDCATVCNFVCAGGPRYWVTAATPDTAADEITSSTHADKDDDTGRPTYGPTHRTSINTNFYLEKS